MKVMVEFFKIEDDFDEQRLNAYLARLGDAVVGIKPFGDKIMITYNADTIVFYCPKDKPKDNNDAIIMAITAGIQIGKICVKGATEEELTKSKKSKKSKKDQLDELLDNGIDVDGLDG